MMVHPFELLKLNICLCHQKDSLYRLLKMVPNDSPTQVSYPHFIHCYNAKLTQNQKKRFLCYDVITVSLHAKLFMLYNVN